MTELETLEAQLADTRQREQLAVKMNLDLQQQVRELRKLLERHDTCSLRNSSTYARSSLAEATAAALRSAPPGAHPSALIADVAQSTPDRSPSRGVTGKEHLATNQEVAALGKQPSAVSAEISQVPAGTQIAETRNESSAGDSTVASARDARPLSEAVNRGPQDSPSRSHYTKHTLRCSYWENNVCDCRTPAPPDFAREKEKAE